MTFAQTLSSGTQVWAGSQSNDQNLWMVLGGVT